MWMLTIMQTYSSLWIICVFLKQEWKCLKMRRSLWFKSTGRLETHDTCSASSDDGWLCRWILDGERLWSSLPYHTHTDTYTLTYRSLATIQSAEEAVGRGNLEMFQGMWDYNRGSPYIHILSLAHSIAHACTLLLNLLKWALDHRNTNVTEIWKSISW